MKCTCKFIKLFISIEDEYLYIHINKISESQNDLQDLRLKIKFYFYKIWTEQTEITLRSTATNYFPILNGIFELTEDLYCEHKNLLFTLDQMRDIDQLLKLDFLSFISYLKKLNCDFVLDPENQFNKLNKKHKEEVLQIARKI